MTDRDSTATERALGRRPWPALLVIVGYSVVAAIPDPMTAPTWIAVALPVLAALGLAVRRGWHRRDFQPIPSKTTEYRTWSIAVWIVLFAVIALVQLANYFADPRSVYPTLSSLVEEPLMFYPFRVAAFALWAGAGWYLVKR